MLESIEALLLDIEGTITSISFVKDTLFPFVRSHLESYLTNNWGTEELQQDLQLIREEVSRELMSDGQLELSEIPADDCGAEPVLNAVVRAVHRWMDQDKKIGALKQLQGHIWREAYRSGQIQGHLYPDVVPTLLKLLDRKDSLKIYIYSSGSVSAQQLLLQYSMEGDVTKLISGYFDTGVGLKVEAVSYRNIASQIGLEPSKILFCTDIEKEAFAAKSAGLHCVLFVRPGNTPLSSAGKSEFRVAHSLEDLLKLHV